MSQYFLWGKGRASEATRVIEHFDRLRTNEQQDVINFVRSL